MAAVMAAVVEEGLVKIYRAGKIVTGKAVVGTLNKGAVCLVMTKVPTTEQLSKPVVNVAEGGTEMEITIRVAVATVVVSKITPGTIVEDQNTTVHGIKQMQMHAPYLATDTEITERPPSKHAVRVNEDRRGEILYL